MAEFVEKILKRIEKIDRASLQAYLKNLKDERDFFKHALDSVPEGILITDASRKPLYANRSLRSILGISHSAALKNKSLRDLVQDEELRAFLEDHFESSRYAVHQEVEMLVPQHAFVSVSIQPLTGVDGNAAGWVALMVNNTVSKERDRQMVKMERIEALTSLAAGVAHEIGNPLNAISIHLRLLEKETDDLPAAKKKRIKELAEIIIAETKRLDNMVKNFLKATRRRPSRMSDENINDVLSAAVRFLQPELREAGVECVLKLSDQIPVFLFDPEKMHQVFLNIVKNSIESMPDGGKIEISSQRKEKICLLTFSDDGSGIDEEDLPNIFDAYFTTKEEGSGLGLMIVSEIIKEHGGRVEVKSKRGKGTIFKILLPIRFAKLQLPEKLS